MRASLLARASSFTHFTSDHLYSLCTLFRILGDPGATSRNDAIFSGERHFWRESLFQGLKSPWALFLTKRVPEMSKSVPLIGQKNIFLANQRGDLAG